MFALEQPLLQPLPEERLRDRPGSFQLRVDRRYADHRTVPLRYSVPVRLIGHPVRVLLHASHLVIYHKEVEVTQHEWLIAKTGSRLELDHFLEVLLRKPGALPGATALDQARQSPGPAPIGTPVQLPGGLASSSAAVPRLPVDTRPLPSVAAYDELLPSRRALAPPATSQGDAS